MLRTVFILLLFFISWGPSAQAIKYDNESNVVYVIDNGVKKSFHFSAKSSGNSETWFDFFDKKPAIVNDVSSLDSFSSYATLMYVDGDFYVDCVYVDFKSNKNGVYEKNGFCGLNKKINDGYEDVEPYILSFSDEITKNINLIDTLRLINEKSKYLSIVSYRNKEKTLTKVVDSRDSLIKGDYFYKLEFEDSCSYFKGAPWVIYNDKNKSDISLKAERKNEQGVDLVRVVPEVVHGQCMDFKPITIGSEKTYIYINQNKTKSYLVRGDFINYLYTDDSERFCEISYINNKNAHINGAVLCSDISY